MKVKLPLASEVPLNLAPESAQGVLVVKIAGCCTSVASMASAGPLMLMSIRDGKRTAREFMELAKKKDSGVRLMGFGHRIYRTRDPRADALKAAVARLPKSAGRLAFAETVEREALAVLAAHKPGRVLQTNVEFYTALLLESVGFPAEAFTAVFAMGRVAGWLAHAREQALTGRLIRPQSVYVREEMAAA